MLNSNFKSNNLSEEVSYLYDKCRGCVHVSIQVLDGLPPDFGCLYQACELDFCKPFYNKCVQLIIPFDETDC